MLISLLSDWGTSASYEAYKVASIQIIPGTVLLDFWLILLSWMFIPSYAVIYFFVKKFIFSNVYVSVNTIFECLYSFLVEKGTINQVRTQLAGWWWFIQNACSCVKEEGVSRLMCTYAFTLSLLMFLTAFSSCSVSLYL